MFKIKGLNEVQRSLQDLQRRAENISGAVEFADLFPPEFMRQYTDYTEIDEFVAASGYEVNSNEDFERIPTAEWDAFVEAKTRFSGWAEMKQKAVQEFATRRLGLGD